MGLSGQMALPKAVINNGIKDRLPYKREIKWRKPTEVLYTHCTYICL